MPTYKQTLAAICVALFSLLFPWQAFFSGPSASIPRVVGANNTALFIVTSDHGLSNAHLATAHGLLERHPHIRVHIASFAPLASRVERLSSYRQGENMHKIEFHLIKGTSNVATARSLGMTQEVSIHPPGWSGIGKMCNNLKLIVSPWTAEDHLDLYNQVSGLIDMINPAVVVLDTLFRPAIDATRNKNRLHAFISPNTLIENFASKQPWGEIFWKYPAFGSGFPYPLPWSRIPENILLNFRILWTMTTMPGMREKKAFLRSKGLKDPINFSSLHRPDVPWISQTMPEASVPVDVIPPNVTCVGPMVLPVDTVAKQDKEMARWLEGGPGTVMVNPGSLFRYTEARAIVTAEALARLLQDTEVQILWKITKLTDFSDQFMEPLAPFIKTGRARVESWLAVDPPSLLESGHIVASVHHGGSGCYHEAISAGVPQIILPFWLDLYSFAQLSEYIGVGVWGCRATSPEWTADCLHESMMRVVQSPESDQFREKAKELSLIAQAKPGRYLAAQEIAKLAGSGI
ncbi:hypothetical protein F4778DRAFT_318361 [Xylariomycetidae sp. FL2044]|nr:hypothetical protein F4778DRAFT_318361 [Xylariomycetidae sp. FL2044]